jgi:hypothetical protein
VDQVNAFPQVDKKAVHPLCFVFVFQLHGSFFMGKQPLYGVVQNFTVSYEIFMDF